ncbi:hypothetical protein NCS56_01205500 [Fusarium sp. Ph1]|nr:hypothetical protein NCS56_01205500 [Fusarium sp. Ph1]
MHQPPYPENTWSQPSPREYEPVAQNEQRDLPSPLETPLETPLDNDNLHQPHPVQHAWSPTAPREYKAVPQNVWPIEEDRSDSPPPLKSEGPSSELPKSDYRPIALRWQFIGLIIVAIVAILGAMGYALHELKNSDSTYKLESRSFDLQGSLGLMKRTILRFETRDVELLKRELGIVERQDTASEPAVVSVETGPTQAANEPAAEPSQEPADAVTSVEVKPSPTQLTVEAPTEEAPTEDKTEPSPTQDDNKSSPSPTEDDSNGSSPSPTEKSKSSPSPTEDDESDSSATPTDDDIISSPTPTDNKAKNKPSTTVTDDKDKTSPSPTETDDDDSKTSPTATETDDEPRLVTAIVEAEYTSTIVSSSAVTAFSTDAVVTKVEKVASTMVYTVAGYTSTYALQPEEDEPQGFAPKYTTEIQPAKETTRVTYMPSTYVTTLATTQTSFGPPVTYVETGTTRLTSVFYVDDDGKPIEKAVTQVKTSERPATVMTITETPPVETILQTQADGQVVTILSTPLPTTRVTSVGPTRVVVTDVSTPTGDFKIVMEVTEYTLTGAGYFIGAFLPPIIAVLLAMTLRAIHQAATQFQPFAALSRPEGALGKDALTLRFDGIDSITIPFKLLANSQPLPFITALAAWGSSLFAPLASEAIGLKIHGRCRKGAIGGCAVELGISERSAYGLLALLIAIGALLIATIIVISRRWSTGVAANPLCSANAAALMARNPDLRALPLHDYRALKDAVVDKRFKMGTFRNYEGRDEYGVVLHHGHNHGAEAYGTTPFDEGGPRAQSHRAPQTFAALTFWYRFLFGVFLLCLLGFICYYHFTDTFGHLPKGLKNAMESSQFGVRFICSAIGVAIIWLWDMLFTSVAAITPFRRMADKSQSPTRSVLMTPPTNAFSGLFVALRAGDLLLFLTAVASLMAQFLPILFANVPYNLTQTRLAHQVCSRLSAGLLVFMVIGLFGSLFVKWPDLPVDPRSLVGAMYYVAEAPWVAGVEGVAGMNAKDRKNKIQGLGGRWSYGYVQTGHGRRLAIEHEMGYR